ncbi:hypothetical protein GGI42DRAFT_10115 [Trichoderma sp. SZMC 28013]
MALVNASAKRRTNDMSSIETLLRRRLLVPAPSLLPVSGLGKLAVLKGQREGQPGRWPREEEGSLSVDLLARSTAQASGGHKNRDQEDFGHPRVTATLLIFL